ncbi:acyl-CoA N-acyltransferase [Trichodelitschia bisporula]|uniref:Glucosamine 6-phosphate N-acetyltransferase n=1 Tax=Trichodelitschia bisporula TaxID=703511 RepID=A0A6G1HKS4_9PEZI|nr:acyl-CoA N-acyltransferase [Trichodelitschia bisporula]
MSAPTSNTTTTVLPQPTEHNKSPKRLSSPLAANPPITSTLLAPPPPIVTSKSEGNMRRAFSLRKPKSPSPAPGDNGGHSRGHSVGHAHVEEKDKNRLSPPGSNGNAGGLGRSLSRRQKVARAIANPETIFERDPGSPPAQSRFNPDPNSRLVRTFFNPRIDFAPAPVASPAHLPDPDLPLFNSQLVSRKVAEDLPEGYSIRPLCRSDYDRGYMDLLRVLGRTGWVSEQAWDERCEWLRSMAKTYYIVVILDAGERVVASGTMFLERKFVQGMGVVGHVEDIAVAKDQKGKKMGLRVLEALVYVAQVAGCYKTMVNCTEANEAFHKQCGFAREGSQMVLHHVRKTADAYV